MHVDGVKEALHNDDGITAAGCAMKIEKDKGLSESRRESVFGFRPVNGPSGISDKEAVLVVDRNHNPPLHEARPAVMADSKVASSVWGNSATLVGRDVPDPGG